MTDSVPAGDHRKLKRHRRGRTGAALRQAQREKEAKKNPVRAEEDLDAAYAAVADAILAGKTRFSGEDELIGNDIAFHAVQEFIKGLGDNSSLDALDRAVLKYAGVDPDHPRTWPEEIHAERLRRRMNP